MTAHGGRPLAVICEVFSPALGGLLGPQLPPAPPRPLYLHDQPPLGAS